METKPGGYLGRTDAVRERWVVGNAEGTHAWDRLTRRGPKEWVPIADVRGWYPTAADAIPACYDVPGARPLRIA